MGVSSQGVMGRWERGTYKNTKFWLGARTKYGEYDARTECGRIAVATPFSNQRYFREDTEWWPTRARDAPNDGLAAVNTFNMSVGLLRRVKSLPEPVSVAPTKRVAETGNAGEVIDSGAN